MTIEYFSNQTLYLIRTYTADLSEDELMVRPAPGANHAKWQLGHVALEAHRYLSWAGVPLPALPDGFEAAHQKSTANVDDPARFWPKETYLTLLKQIHKAGVAHLAGESEARLAQPGPEEARAYMPTIAALYHANLGGHLMMHIGQFALLRRILGKPVVI
jgi:hypothetical protein